MATYVNDLRLKEISTGDESGTWGTSTNTNLELIAEAFSYGTEAITTNADTHTTTIADGSTDPGRSIYLKYTGTLDSACTITIGPNTVSKLWFIENGTSGSQNIIISQGSGANITIPAGDTKAVYSDGAGSGAAIVDAFASLNVVDLKVEDDLTLSSDSAVITFGADGDTTLTHTDGTGLTLNSTNKLCFNDASQFIQGSSATVLSLGATDEIDLTATAIDVNGTMDVSGAITSSAGATITTADNTTQLTLISTDADANAGPNLDLYRNSSSPADNDNVGQINWFAENDAGEKIEYAEIRVDTSDVSDGSEDARVIIQTATAGGIGTSRIEILPTETVINQDSKDLDFRVESDGNANMLFVDGGKNSVGIGTTPEAHYTGYVGLDIGLVTSLFSNASSTNITTLTNNGFLNSDASQWTYKVTDEATMYSQVHGDHRFSTAASGSADAAITWSEKVRFQAAGGISFNGDTAAANALDDYEEGTFTPGLGGATLSTATGKYTKIGNQVTVYYHVVTTGGLPTSTAQVQVSSLPFTIDSNGAGSIYARFYTLNDSTLTTILVDGDTVVRLININEQDFDYTLYGELEASSNNSLDIRGTATYIAE